MGLKASYFPIWARVGYFCRYNRQKILISLGVILAGLILLSVFSATFCEERGGLQKVVENMITDIANTDFYTSVANDAKVNVSSGTIQMGSASVNVRSIITVINSFLVGVGTVVAMVLWFPTLAASLISGQMYSEIVIKRMCALGVSIFLVLNSLSITESIVNAGSEVVDKIAGLATTYNVHIDATSIVSTLFDYEAEEFEPEEPESKNPIAKAIVGIKNKFGEAVHDAKIWLEKNLTIPLRAIIYLFVPWVLMFVVQALVSVFTISRAVEIVILIMMSPIPFAIVGNEPLGQGAGARFIKNLFALSLQGAVMVLVAFVCNSIAQGTIGSISGIEDLSAATWRFLAVGFAEIALLAKSLTISQKVFGLQ
ncbi:MAG: hypothetical protein IJ245_06385 [Lachnospiraceae bacterium]|nr:hypothetical protein [Lachnospiraceae bacterium]